MKNLFLAVLLLGPLAAGAQVVSTTPDPSQPPAPAPQSVPPPPPAALPAPPSALLPGPNVTEPPPTSDQYAPPPETGQYSEEETLPPPNVQVAPPSPSGQWVYTAQYGWIWMPYGTAYTYLPAGAYPDMYCYFPAYGWRWVVAPWVWGLGPRPWFGVYGFARFPWYGRGYGRWYGWHGPVWTARGWGSGWVRPVPHPGYVRPGVPHPVYRAPARPGGFSHGVMMAPRPVPHPAPSGGFGRSSVGHPGGFAARPGGFGGARGGFGRH